MKIDTALYNNEKQHQLEGYFIVDTILSRDFSDVYVFLMPRLCCKPSDQPRDAARREECSNRMKRV